MGAAAILAAIGLLGGAAVSTSVWLGSRQKVGYDTAEAARVKAEVDRLVNNPEKVRERCTCFFWSIVQNASSVSAGDGRAGAGYLRKREHSKKDSGRVEAAREPGSASGRGEECHRVAAI